MKLKAEPSHASSQPASPIDESAGFIVSRERVPGSPLSEESRNELEVLSHVEDKVIDYSEIPPLTDDFFHNAVRGWLPLETRTVQLLLDAEVYDWLTRDGFTNVRRVNHVLRREMQMAQRHEPAAQDAEPEPSTMSKAS